MGYGRWSVLITVMLLCLPPPSVAESQPASRPDDAAGARILDHSLLKQPSIPVALVTVVRVERDADGPTADMRVEEVLRGTFPVGTFRVEFTHEESSSLPTKIERLSESKPGDVWLVFFSPTARTPRFLLEAHARSDELLSFVNANLAPPERSGAVQGPLLVLILALPFVSKVRGLRRPLVASIAVVIQLGLYAFYESGISMYTNIRIDLFLVYSAIVYSLVVASRSIASKSKARDESA